MKHSLLGWSIERPNIHSRCYHLRGCNIEVFTSRVARD